MESENKTELVLGPGKRTDNRNATVRGREKIRVALTRYPDHEVHDLAEAAEDGDGCCEKFLNSKKYEEQYMSKLIIAASIVLA